ncbi:MAG TPA: TonB-dependent receptor, partial [Sphingopyxis sp.]|nr:TonB-dependent receptor [Sphingopyxis sp.]
AELLLNATSRNGQDVTAYAATPLGGDWSASVTGGFHHQTRKDLDGDGWSDMAHYDRWTVRPRLFWERGDGAKLLLTAGAMDEVRRGGTMPGRTVPDGSAFPLNQHSERFDAGLVAELPVEGVGTVQLRASGTTQRHGHVYGPSIEDDRHDTLFAEAALGGRAGRTSWLAGIAVQADRYRSDAFPTFDYRYTVPALFAQVEQEIGDLVVLAGSARLDDHSDYGTRFSPRLSLLFRPDRWTVRASVGRGFYAPTPFVDAIDEAGLSRLEPIGALKAEVADTASLDIGYADGPFEANVTLFGSDVDNGLQLQDVAADRVRLVNTPGVTRAHGAELTARYRWNDIMVRGSYVYLDSSEPDPSGAGRRAIPQTPKHTAGLVAMWEQHGRGRVGLEAYYTGRQSLDDNPYRARSRRYVELGALAEITLGKVSLFVNAENILDVRQTRYDSILRPARTNDGRWTVDAWAPSDGRVINGGIRLRFGGG